MRTGCPRSGWPIDWPILRRIPASQVENRSRVCVRWHKRQWRSIRPGNHASRISGAWIMPRLVAQGSCNGPWRCRNHTGRRSMGRHADRTAKRAPWITNCIISSCASTNSASWIPTIWAGQKSACGNMTGNTAGLMSSRNVTDLIRSRFNRPAIFCLPRNRFTSNKANSVLKRARWQRERNGAYCAQAKPDSDRGGHEIAA